MQLAIQNLLPIYFDAAKKEPSQIWGKDLDFRSGQMIHIVAPSGSGKTSLVHFLYGMRSDYAGTISYNNKSLRQFDAEDYAALRKKHVSVVFQDLRLFPEQTIQENLEIKRQLNPYHAPEKILEMADRLGIASRLQTKAKVCSYGEQQRTAIIRALLQPFDYLLLDEAFSHLDTENAKKAMALILEESTARNATVLYADLEKTDYFDHDQLFHL